MNQLLLFPSGPTFHQEWKKLVQPSWFNIVITNSKGIREYANINAQARRFKIQTILG